MPTSWAASLGTEFRGCVRYARRFTRPTDLESYERVWLVFEGVDSRAQLVLNEEPLGRLDGYALRGAFEITGRLRDRNELVMDVELPFNVGSAEGLLRPGRAACAGGLIGEVRLEIRSLRYVSDFAVQLEPTDGDPRVSISGQIAGHREHADLALVVNGLRRELAYQPITAQEPFSLELSLPGLPRWQLLPSGGENELEPLEVAMLENAAEHWRAVRGLAHRELDWNADRGELSINGKPLELPAGRLLVEDFPASPSQWRTAVDTVGSGVLVAEMIFPTACYTALDRWGIAVIQSVPAGWQQAIVPRLAQHPSVVAWISPESEPQREPTDKLVAGRPWLSRSVAVR